MVTDSANVRGSVGIKDVIETLQSGQVRSLQDVNNIEAALELIKNSQDQIGQYKELKKKRVEAINQEIETLENRVEFFKQVISTTLKTAKQKTIKFPGVGKVSCRTTKGKWVVLDENEILKILEEEDEVKTCVETKQVIKKTELNNLLDVWERVNKLPECVEREPSADSVTITYEKATVDDPDVVTAPVKPQKAVNVSALSFTS